MQADLIVTVGLDAIELQPKPWPYAIPVISLANTPTLEALVPAQSEMIGNLKTMLAALSEFAPEGSGWGDSTAKSFREQVTIALDVPTQGLSPQGAMEVARAVLPRETVATCDAGASRLLVVQSFKCAMRASTRKETGALSSYKGHMDT